jgi:hypothetical protein
VVASGLEPLEAVMVKTPGMAGLFGWPEPHPDPAPHKKEWAEAEASTDRIVGRALGALDAAERTALVDLAVAAAAGAT